MQAWKRIEPTLVTQIGYRTIVTKTFVLPNGQTKEFQTFNLENSHCAGIVALTKDRLVIISEQYRPGPQKTMAEIPGGAVELNEDYLAAAIRELAEETAYQPGLVEPLGDVYKDAYNNCLFHYFLATDCTKMNSAQNLDDNEFVKVSLIRIDQLIDNAIKGRMSDAEAVLLAMPRLQEYRHSL